MNNPNKKRYTPPEALRWLALTSGPAACEMLEYAEKAASHSARPTREMFIKSLGFGRVQSVIQQATDLGTSFLKAGQTIDNILYRTPPKPISLTKAIAEAGAKSILHSRARELATLAAREPKTKTEMLDAAKACYQFAELIEGWGGESSVNVGLVVAETSGRQAAVELLSKLMDIENATHTKQRCSITLADNLFRVGEFNKAICSVENVNNQRHPSLALSASICEFAFAIHFSEFESTKFHVDQISKLIERKDEAETILLALRAIKLVLASECHSTHAKKLLRLVEQFAESIDCLKTRLA